jgi:hypothetical protein
VPIDNVDYDELSSEDEGDTTTPALGVTVTQYSNLFSVDAMGLRLFGSVQNATKLPPRLPLSLPRSQLYPDRDPTSRQVPVARQGLSDFIGLSAKCSVSFATRPIILLNLNRSPPRRPQAHRR